MKTVAQLLALSVLSLLSAASLRAQVAPSVPKVAPSEPAARNATAGDAVIAAWLMIASNNEVALAGTAQQKAVSSEVKQFAQRMVGDHGRFAQNLQPIATTASRGSDNAGRTNDRDGAGRQQQPADASGVRQANPGGGFDHMALIRDLGKKCLDAETNLLNDKSGTEFDRCYMRMQVLGHTKAAAMIEAFGAHASDQLRPILEEGHKTVLAHLEHAKGLCKQLEDGANAASTTKAKAEKVPGGK